MVSTVKQLVCESLGYRCVDAFVVVRLSLQPLELRWLPC